MTQCVYTAAESYAQTQAKNKPRNTLLFFYKNTLYKNIEAQIWYFEMGFSENICANFKLVIKTNRGHHKKRFKHIVEGGVKVENV